MCSGPYICAVCYIISSTSPDKILMASHMQVIFLLIVQNCICYGPGCSLGTRTLLGVTHHGNGYNPNLATHTKVWILQYLLLYWGIRSDSCQLGNGPPETLAHFLLTCPTLEEAGFSKLQAILSTPNDFY